MKTQGLSPSQPPWRLGGLGSEGQGPRLRMLALLDEACEWVNDLNRLVGGSSFTELALKLYRFIVFNEDENGAWREFMIEYGHVDPQQLDVFTTNFDGLKKASVERVITACRKTLKTPLGMLSELLSSEVLPAVGSKTLAEVLQEGIRKDIKYTKDGVRIEDVLDLSRGYDVLEREIATLVSFGLDMDKDRVQNMMDCLLEC